MRIVDVCEVTKPIASPIRNAYIDFSKMTTSLVAVVTDAVRDGRRVVGYGFNSNGRYGQGGLIRERFRDPFALAVRSCKRTPDGLDLGTPGRALLEEDAPRRLGGAPLLHGAAERSLRGLERGRGLGERGRARVGVPRRGAAGWHIPGRAGLWSARPRARHP